jgi:hypothetical protein
MGTQETWSPEFAPPSSYALEPELYGPPPRTIPDSLRQGPYARSRKTIVAGFAAFGILCLLLRSVPGMDTVAQYILPLQYLGWIGGTALVVAALLSLELVRNTGPFRYIRDGIPLTVRILALTKAPTMIVNGVPSRHAFTAYVLFKHPESGELIKRQVQSNDFPSSQKDEYDTPFRVGDYVTAVHLPGKLDKTLRVYAFLALSPAHDQRLRVGGSTGESPAKAAALALAVVAFFAILLANFYALGRYEPLAFEYSRARWPMVAGGIVLGGGMLTWLYSTHRRELRKIQARANEVLMAGAPVEAETPFMGAGFQGWVGRIVLALGAPLLGALTALCWCFMANALRDTSAPRRVPVKIERMTVTTHALLFREYRLEYSLAGSAHKEKLLTTPDHLRRIEGRDCEALIRAGRLGWPWVETVTPVAEGPAGATTEEL